MGADLSKMLSIQGNIRQQYLPFVLKPGSNINANVDNSNLTDGPQLFSFRNKKADQYSAGFGRLNICPSVLTSPVFGMPFNMDMSNQLIFDYSTHNTVSIDRFFNQLPGMQIREFQVDAKLDQFINMFFELFQGAKSLFKGSSGLFEQFKIKDLIGLGSDAARSRWLDMMGEVISAVWDYITCQGKFNGGPNLMQGKDGSSRWLKNLTAVWDNACSGLSRPPATSGLTPDLNTYLMDFPFAMYYRLQSCTTLNIYELPYIGDLMWQSNGEEGWKDAQFGLKSLTGGGDSNDKGGMISKVVSMFSGGWGDIINRANINYMPKWDSSGSGMVEELAVTFDLFNDTADAAMKNFIFVNTIIPNNLWMQYGMLRHSPCLYDVKIDGLKRMFLCTGAFNVKSAGLLRTPPMQWIYDLCCKHANGGGESGGKTQGSWNPSSLIGDIVKNNLVKIPDVYTVEMKFKSLIPANFNTFLYNYSRNSDMKLYTNKNAYQPSVVGAALSSVTSDLGGEIQKIIEQGNKEISQIRAANGYGDNSGSANVKK